MGLELDLALTTREHLCTSFVAESLLDLVESIDLLAESAASLLSYADPLTGEFRTIINRGYSTKVESHLNTRFMLDDPALTFQRTPTGAPARWRDLPFDYYESETAQQYLIPEGFHEGITILIQGGRGHELGALHLSVDNRSGLGDDQLRLVLSARRVLSNAMATWSFVDGHSFRSDSTAAVDEPGLVDQFVVSTNGHTAHLAGRDVCRRDPALRDVWHQVSYQVSVAAAQLGHNTCVRGYVEGRTGEVWLAELRPTVQGCVVTATSTSWPRGLSPREVEVAGLIALSLSHTEIASRLFISVRTVDRHVDNLYRKLGCDNRAAAAVICDRENIRRIAMTLWNARSFR